MVREFASKKHVKLGRLLVKQKEKHRPRCERGGDGGASIAIAASGQPGSGRGGDGGIELESETPPATVCGFLQYLLVVIHLRRSTGYI